jgi:hypothetical protein
MAHRSGRKPTTADNDAYDGPADDMHSSTAFAGAGGSRHLPLPRAQLGGVGIVFKVSPRHQPQLTSHTGRT